MELTTFIHGSAHDLHQLADGSVQMIATSPPYYGLRAYAGEQGVEWPEVTFRLNEWVEPTVVAPMRCGLGMEPTPVAFIAHLILCLREWRRVLRDDGVCFVNLGDSYAGGNGNGGQYDFSTSGLKRDGRDEASRVRTLTQNAKELQRPQPTGSRRDTNVKPKDLLGIPWLFAIAARADGWFLRSDIIWAKPNPMPESVTDRPTKAHEYVFLLSKSGKYFWDAEAVREDLKQSTLDRYEYGWNGVDDDGSNGSRTGSAFKKMKAGATMGEVMGTAGRNIRTVWNIATQPTPFAHFATWPEKLVQTMIRAGSSERGACPHCGKAWVRVVERIPLSQIAAGADNPRPKHKARMEMGLRSAKSGLFGSNSHNESTPQSPIVNTLGFAPTCACGCTDTVPCVVLDPFNGSGTTGKVAVQLGRAYVGVDIATEYLDGVTSERFGAGVQIGMGM